ncbi:MAG TPA: hypothetical protein VGR79_04435 [Stellaceae bacterium]|nr:hypothetical protein [Stellaceae bacterium]
MCDYSLEAYRTRPAREGERYVTIRFNSGSIGLAAPGDVMTPVCVACDTPLHIEDIPAHVQARLGINAAEDATLVHLDQGSFRDGVRFANGGTIALYQLGTGVGVTVTALLENAGRIERPAERRHERQQTAGLFARWLAD